MNSKKIFVFFYFLFISGSVFCQLNYETKLFQCIQNEFSDRGQQLELGMDSLEVQLINLGHLSDDISLYDLFKSQAKSDTPLIISEYVETLDVRYNSYREILKECYELDYEGRETSKYYQVVQRINSTKEKLPYEIWHSIHEIIKPQDYTHQFYKLQALSTIQSWSLSSANLD